MMTWEWPHSPQPTGLKFRYLRYVFIFWTCSHGESWYQAPLMMAFFLYSCTRLTEGECIQQLIGVTPIALLGTGNCSVLWVNQLSLYFKLILVNLVPEEGALVQLFQNTFIKKNKFKKKKKRFNILPVVFVQFSIKKKTVFRDWICKSLRSVYSGIRDP